MIFEHDVDISSRKHAALLLSDKLIRCKNTDAQVIAIPFGGVPIGFCLADHLNLDFYVMPCRMISRPGKVFKSIGSISVDDVYIHDDILDVPQNYLYHQIQTLKSNIANEFNVYNAIQPKGDFADKTVIIVDDVVVHSDAVMALLKGIQKQNPAKIIFSVAFIGEEALWNIAKEVDEVVFLYKDRNVQRICNMAAAFPKVKKEDVKSMLLESVSEIAV
jgi:putative phosphoribosyl transferase